MSKESLKRRIDKKLQEIAKKEGLTHFEVEKIYKSQFKFAKETIEALDLEWIKNATQEELGKYIFKFVYIGKLVTSAAIRDWEESVKTYRLRKQKKQDGED